MFDFRSFTEEQKERILKKFEASFVKKDKHECWLWHGEKWPNGYGRLRIYEKRKPINFQAHRASWSIFFGTFVPDGLLCCHTCDVRNCINPYHLKISNDKDNITDRDIRERDRPRGRIPIPFHRKVEYVRRYINGEKGADLAKELGRAGAASLYYWSRTPAMRKIFGHIDLSHRTLGAFRGRLRYS